MALLGGLGLAALAEAGEAPAPRRMAAANWTQHRKLGAPTTTSTSAGSKAKLQWRSLEESPAAIVSDEAEASEADLAEAQVRQPERVAVVKRRAGGATKLRVKVQPGQARAQAKAQRRAAVVPVAHEATDDEPVLQLAQQDTFDPFGGTAPQDPSQNEDAPLEPLDESPLPQADELLPDATEPATEPAAEPMPETAPAEAPAAPAEETAPAIDEPPAMEPYAPGIDSGDIGTVSPQPAEDSADEFPTNTLPGDLCANNKYGCRQALDILQDDTLVKVGPGIALSGAEGVNFPCVCPLGDEQYAGRSWSQTCFEWKASSICHKPLYFEEVGLERYGHAVVLQPAVSAARFFVTVPLLPYEMGMRPPWECVYPLGHYRPGSCAPYYIPPVPVSLRGGLLEAGVVTGLVYIIP